MYCAWDQQFYLVILFVQSQISWICPGTLTAVITASEGTYVPRWSILLFGWGFIANTRVLLLISEVPGGAAGRVRFLVGRSCHIGSHHTTVMYWGSWESDRPKVSRTDVGAKGGASTAAVVCRRRESESESRWWNGVRKWMARRVRSLSKRGADAFEKEKKASGRCRRQGVRSCVRSLSSRRKNLV